MNSRHTEDGASCTSTDRGRLIVCSELCRKPKPRELRTVVGHAQRNRADYFAARASGKIVMEGSPWHD